MFPSREVEIRKWIYLARFLRRQTLNFNNFCSFHPFSTRFESQFRKVYEIQELLFRHKREQNWSKSTNVVLSQLTNSRVNRSSDIRWVNPRTCSSLETKLFHTFVRRSHHSQMEEHVCPSNDRDMKYQHFAPYESKKLDYTKSWLFRLWRPSRESSDSEQQTFFYTNIFFDFSNRLWPFKFWQSYRKCSTCSHSFNFDFNMFSVEVFGTAWALRVRIYLFEHSIIRINKF